MTVLYGIKNCDTIKKTRLYLEQKKIDYRFHDYRTDGLTQGQLEVWVTALGWESLINKRSTTWRQLPDSVKDDLDAPTAIELMLKQPTLIKRPLLELNADYCLGFSVAHYDAIFADKE